MRRMTETGKWRDQWFRALSINAKLLWIYICDNCDCAGFWSIDIKLASFEIGLTEKVLQQALIELQQGVEIKDGILWLVRYLEVQKCLPLSDNCHPHKAIISRLRQMESFSANISQVLAGERPVKGNGTQPIGLPNPIGIGIGVGSYISRTIKRGYKGEKQLLGSYSEDFLRFWNAYPRKQAKSAAWVAWNKCVDIPAIEVLVKSVEAQKRINDWIKDGGKWIPHPATWINNRRWEDEVSQKLTTESKKVKLDDLIAEDKRIAEQMRRDKNEPF